MVKVVKIVTKDSREFRGIIVNETKDYIILKLKNGYNIGINSSDILSVEPLEDTYNKDNKGATPYQKTTSQNNRDSISIIATGGTILSKVDYTTGGVHMLTRPEELLEIFPELFNIVNIKEIKIPFSIASEDMTPKEWIKIAKLSEELLNDRENLGIIIMHGTDTMSYTSSALSFMLRNLHKPVAMTGSQRSSDRPSSDAFINLLASAAYAKSDIAEVAVVMHGTTSDNVCYATRGTRVRKMHTERRDAFQPIEDIPLAKITIENDKIRVDYTNQNFRKRNNDGMTIADTKLDDRVVIVKAYPGANPEIIDFYVDKGYRGIVLEGTGFGHVPTSPLDEKYSWINSIKRGIERGVVFVMTSQTIFGRTNPFVYSNARKLYNLGVIYVENMLTEVAYTKLMWILGHTDDYNEIKRLMLTNIAGEITERSLFKSSIL